jgi:NADP-reducing hydrogenase subunit HndB
VSGYRDSTVLQEETNVPKLTIEDLTRVRDQASRALALRSGQARARVTVHLGTCGIAAGARDVMTSLLQAIEQHAPGDVIVTTSGCAGLCSREPMATVELRDEPPVKYVNLTPGKMKQVFTEHILGGRIVTDCALASGSETTG